MVSVCMFRDVIRMSHSVCISNTQEMSYDASHVTLIFYRVGNQFWKEPILNIMAAAFTMSSFTHVEIAIGDEAGDFGKMCNVCRIFNDDVGVELTSRTGMNPQYSYLQLGCTSRAMRTMLSYARSLVGKPFSNIGMARSVVYPRKSNGESFFCAELVASILKQGGLMSSNSNPGAATPESLHRLYKNNAAMTANPYTLRQFSSLSQDTCAYPRQVIGFRGLLEDANHHERAVTTARTKHKRSDGSPPRATFQCISSNTSGRVDASSIIHLMR